LWIEDGTVLKFVPSHHLCSFSGTCEPIVEHLRGYYGDTVCYQCLKGFGLWRPACLYTGMADRVLIIDDDDQLVDAYRDYLSESGYQVDCAQELEEAQTLLAHFSYSVVITDLRLSKLAFGGLDLVKYVREGSLQTRIIVLTAYGWPELKAEASAAGADVFLRKPLRLKELGKTVVELAGASA
jgi:CheY-like chemotaxis protein